MSTLKSYSDELKREIVALAMAGWSAMSFLVTHLITTLTYRLGGDRLPDDTGFLGVRVLLKPHATFFPCLVCALKLVGEK